MAESCSDGKPSVPSKSIRIASKCFRKGKRMVSFPGFQFSMTFSNSMENHGEDSPTSLPAASHAKGTAQPEGEKAKKIKGICGRTRSVSYAKWHPPSRSWKTCRGFFPLTISAKSLVTWRRAGTMRNGVLYPQRPLVPHISGKGFGFSRGSQGSNIAGVEQFPTPQTSMPMNLRENVVIRNGRIIRKSGWNYGITLVDHVTMWPTPKASRDGISPKTLAMVAAGEAELSLDRAVLMIGTPTSSQRKRTGQYMKGRTPNPAELVAMLPTPTVADTYLHKKMPNSKKGESVYLDETGKPRKRLADGPSASLGLARIVLMEEQVNSDGGILNPDWVEWLMGWPPGWTDLQPLAMDKFQRWLRLHSSYWPAVQEY